MLPGCHPIYQFTPIKTYLNFISYRHFIPPKNLYNRLSKNNQGHGRILKCSPGLIRYYLNVSNRNLIIPSGSVRILISWFWERKMRLYVPFPNLTYRSWAPNDRYEFGVKRQRVDLWDVYVCFGELCWEYEIMRRSNGFETHSSVRWLTDDYANQSNPISASFSSSSLPLVGGHWKASCCN